MIFLLIFLYKSIKVRLEKSIVYEIFYISFCQILIQNMKYFINYIFHKLRILQFVDTSILVFLYVE